MFEQTNAGLAPSQNVEDRGGKQAAFSQWWDFISEWRIFLRMKWRILYHNRIFTILITNNSTTIAQGDPFYTDHTTYKGGTNPPQ